MATNKQSAPLTLVVDGVHVHYKAYASGRRAQRGRRLLERDKGVTTVHALKGISFSAREGESIGVIGHNGSGKSSLLNAIAGLVAPSKGAVYASSAPAILGVTSVLIPELSGQKNIELGTFAMGMSRAEAKKAYPEIVEFSGLKEFVHMPMRTYSAGMSARLRFSVATARQHSILMVDEALAVGDKGFRARAEERMREMAQSASTVFLVSHSMESIRGTCSRVLWIDQGRLKMDGPADHVVSAYEEGQR